MTLNSLKSHVVGLGKRHRGPEHGDILSSREFRQLIRRERTRADRNSHLFALVVFELVPRQLNGQFSMIAGILSKNARAADEIGWVGQTSLGIFLPDTDEDGASVFCTRVKLDLMGRASLPNYCVYVYPNEQSDDDHDGDGDAQQLHFSTIISTTHVECPLSTPCESDDRAGKPAQSATPPGVSSPDVDMSISRNHGIEQFCSVGMPVWKRVGDIAGASVLLILFSPLLILIAALIWILSPGPVIFRQKRIGYAAKPFTCLKFRTMHVDNDDGVHNCHFNDLIQSTGTMTKLDGSGDPRIFPLGKFLRVAALDELPQLINVLKGEMSLIGPRPCIPYEYEAYRHWYRERVDALPGLTGLWQVSGKNRLTVDQMMRLDIRYSWQKSLRLDLIILLKTPAVILQQIRDTFAPKWATFQGLT